MIEYAKTADAHLLDGPALHRQQLNRAYLMSLTAENLLRPFLIEAGLWSYSGSVGTTIGERAGDGPESWHWGWESPTSELRGHILGHWLSAASHLAVGDPEVAARAEGVVAELARCQAANGDGWIAGIPRDYLHRIAEGRDVWAPQYTVHKLFMGLWDMHAVAGSAQALEVLVGAADWFHRWTGSMSREQLDDVLDVETGGMLEVFADLYGVTGEQRHLDLVHRYDRPRFFDRLLAGEDVLTNRHANTQIPEVLGAARAFEVTGEERWRRVVEAFWRSAVTDRGTYCTGGSTSGEVWQPPGAVSARLHSVQEHCAVHNMMRLAEVLHRWTGSAEHADYWERNLLNGIWAQQNVRTGMVSYFLSLVPASEKRWGSRTDDFWCCHGSLLQSHTHVAASVVQRDDDGLRISQFIPSVTRWRLDGTEVRVRIEQDPLQGVVFGQRRTAAGLRAIQTLRPDLPEHRPDAMVFDVTVAVDRPAELTLRIRNPAWLRGPMRLAVDGEDLEVEPDAAGWLHVRRRWESEHRLHLELPTGIRLDPVPGDADGVTVSDGPYVLAALAPRRLALGEPASVLEALVPDEERTHNWWNAGTYRSTADGVRFVPLNEIETGPYTVHHLH